MCGSVLGRVHRKEDDMIATNDLQMEAYKKLETLSEDDIRLIIKIIDKINPIPAVSKKADRKQKIKDMAGKYDFDEDAINDLRMGSMI